ncbi:hypothetical protein E0Z10_g10626 [Xylaria hypoxylon]|uniref:Protein kinase domain-containing protein n=1 Tax=Xylaria hypoxylon TaxID=37992 RepID=A0A4Z0Y5K5_9PEZI|nr:hypothetical protein E0Z10_g10626 [Xylaria hypoxylon]
MDSSRVRDLERQLRESERRADRAEAQLDEKDAQLEKVKAQRDKVKAQRDKVKAQRDKARAQLLPTTLDEYIEACHNLIYTKLKVEPDPEKRTTGSIPLPYAKFFPRRLRPWTDFHDKQCEILSNVYLHFPIKQRLFDNHNYLETLGNKAMNAPIANEKMLETFLHNCVEDPVRCIIHELSKSRKFQRKLKVGHGIAFENHLKALSDPSYEVVSRQPQQPPPPPPQEPEQICVYRYEEEGTDKRSAIAISEYKPPHKLSLPQLRAGLKETDMMEVVANHKIPEDEEAKFYHYATELVASAVTQAFHYMVKSGLAYGLLTTGEGIVFLKIDWDDPQTVYYHLAEPAEEVAAHNNYRSCSAVSQYLGFHLLALSDYSYRGQDVRDRAISGLHTWSTDFRKAASTVPEDQRIPPRSSPSFIPSAYLSVDRTVPRRSRRRNQDGEHGSDPAMLGSDSDGIDEEEGGSPNRRNTPSPTERQASRRSARLAGRHSDSRGSRGAGGGGRGSDRSEFEGNPLQDLAYCTQKCLLGLVKGDVLDPDCPNLKLHQHRNNYGSVVNTDSRHSISHYEFLQLLSHQLKRTLDYGITSLDITGARGALFKVTLLAYGYTFISKGTVQAFIPDLEHEARVYERLKDVQGVHVPVFLGAIDLRSLNRTYYYDFRVDIVHLCFMSWGGLSLRDVQDLDRNKSTLQPMAVETMRAIHQQGVVHKDARYENILFNPQTGGVMLIDFERSQLLDTPRPALAALEPNKRRRVQDSKGRTKSVGRSGGSDLPPRVQGGFLADMAGVKAAF